MAFLVLLNQFILYFALLLGALFLCFYLYFHYSYTYWARKGVPYLKPKFPLGNNECIGTDSFSYGIETLDWYRELKKRGLKFGGVWNWANPVLVITDPEYAKDVMLKDFNYFSDRDFYHNPKYDPRNESLFVMEKEEWKNLRQKLTPVFTSAKMKTMFTSVVNCSKPMVAVVDAAALKNGDLDIKEIMASFTTDVIGCVVFGLEFGSFSSEEAKFRKMGKEIFRSTFRKKISLILSRMFPKLAQHLRIKNVDENVTDFFEEIIRENVRYRQVNKIREADFTQLLMDLHEATKGQEKCFTFNDLIGNLISFFIAGFDTSSTTIQFALYELARNPELQEKLRKEIRRHLEQTNGELTYEAVHEMTFLRQVIDETLRLYPPVSVMARFCVKPYKFKNTNFTIEKGTTVVLPTIAFGRDPEYFPDPERFDPDRFSPENKGNINPYTYFPFGEGPRNCIGKRFGIMQSSIGLIQILKNYRITISPSTKMPLSLKKGVFLMLANETLYLKAEKLL